MKRFLSSITDTKLKRVILHSIVIFILMIFVFLTAGEAHRSPIAFAFAILGVTSSLASALFLLMFIFLHSFIDTKNIYTKIAASVNLILSGIFIYLYFIFPLFSPFTDIYSLFIALFLLTYFFNSVILFVNFFTNIKIVYVKISNYINFILGVVCACFVAFTLLLLNGGLGGLLSLLFIFGSAFLWCIIPKTKIILNTRRLIVVFALLFPLASSLYYLNTNKPDPPGLELLIPWWVWLVLIIILIAIPILNKFLGNKQIN